MISYPSVLTYVLGAQKNRLIETVLLSTHNIFWLRNKKINFLVGTLKLRTDGYSVCKEFQPNNLTYPYNSISSPGGSGKVEDHQLTRLIKLAVFYFGQVHLTVQFLKQAQVYFCLFCCFTSQVNSYGHCGTVNSPYHTFSWAGLKKRLTSNSCTYFR